ncbi:MAG: DUF177 domain-containing protein [Pseudomonadota bacterium]
MFARHFINSLDFAHHGRELRGELPVAELTRLEDMLAARTGQISYIVQGGRSKDGAPMLAVAIEGVCHLRCQRCLNELIYPISLHTQLLLKQPDELESASAELEEDEPDSILADDHLDVAAMLEEEVLLSLPFAPKHPLGECQGVMTGLDRSEKNPFAVLADLKKSN